MKIQLDYDSKAVTIDSTVDMGEFFDTIEKILPKWKEWKLVTNSQLTTKEIHYIDRPYYARPWWQVPVVTYGSYTSEHGASTWTISDDSGPNSLTGNEPFAGSSPQSGIYCLAIGETQPSIESQID